MTTDLTPLCVDLDGTLIYSDLLLESVVLLLKRNPLYVLLLPLWLLRGKSRLKAEIARRIELNPAALPYNLPLLDWLREQHALQRPIWLATASAGSLAHAVASHQAVFAGVLASSPARNLSGHTKAAQLVAQFGSRGFDYCGNDRADLPIWAASRRAIVVNASRGLESAAGRVSSVDRVFPGRRKVLLSLLRSMRLHQWTKNVLVLVPLAAAHRLGDMHAVLQAFCALVSFGLCASSVYVLNDLLDLEADRMHPRKCKRPFASGDLSIMSGLMLFPILLLLALAAAAWLPLRFGAVLAAYYALTLAYSFGVKKMVIADTIVLAGLYTSRIMAGAAAISVPVSFWLALFSIFLFYSLATVKRYAELDSMQRSGRLDANGRGYHVADLPLLMTLGAACGCLSVLVVALYIDSPAVATLYRHPHRLGALCPVLLFWIGRVWLVTQRGQMHDDPVLFAIKDKTSLALGVLTVVIVALAT